MYHQRLHEPDEETWQYKITAWKEVIGHEKQSDGNVKLQLRDTSNNQVSTSEIVFDLVIVATGYRRDGHEALLESTKDLLATGKYTVGRDYRVQYKPEKVSEDSGIWLQGCNEGSHGVSTMPIDTFKNC